LDDLRLYEKMCARLENLIKAEEDSLRIYSICEACETALRVRGAAKHLGDPDVYIL